MKTDRSRLRMCCVALALLAASAAPAFAQTATGTAQAASAPGTQQFPAIPLRRDNAETGGSAQSAITAALFLAVIAGAGLFLIRRRLPGALAGKASGWLVSPPPSTLPKVVGRTLLTNQASLHAVEWGGEELLLGCTPQSVTVLARRAAQAAEVQSEAKT